MDQKNKFDLDNPKQFEFKNNDINNNLKILEKKLGTRFIIKYTIDSKKF